MLHISESNIIITKYTLIYYMVYFIRCLNRFKDFFYEKNKLALISLVLSKRSHGLNPTEYGYYCFYLIKKKKITHTIPHLGGDVYIPHNHV